MKYIHHVGIVLLALSTSVEAQSLVQGPSWVRPNSIRLDVVGEVMTVTGSPYQGKPCVQFRVLPNAPYSGGRVWVCDAQLNNAVVGEQMKINGQPNDTRITKMGAHHRVVPLISDPIRLIQ